MHERRKRKKEKIKEWLVLPSTSYIYLFNYHIIYFIGERFFGLGRQEQRRRQVELNWQVPFLRGWLRPVNDALVTCFYQQMQTSAMLPCCGRADWSCSDSRGFLPTRYPRSQITALDHKTITNRRYELHINYSICIKRIRQYSLQFALYSVFNDQNVPI